MARLRNEQDLQTKSNFSGGPSDAFFGFSSTGSRRNGDRDIGIKHFKVHPDFKIVIAAEISESFFFANDPSRSIGMNHNDTSRLDYQRHQMRKLPLPGSLLRKGQLVLFERPIGLKAALLRAFRSDVMDNERMGKKPVERARVYFLVSWIQAVLVERERSVPIGWNSKGHKFSDADLSSALHYVDVWLENCVKQMTERRNSKENKGDDVHGRTEEDSQRWKKHSLSSDTAMGKVVFPSHIAVTDLDFASLREMLGEAIYGGWVENPFDRRYLHGLLRNVISPKAFRHDFQLVKDGPKHDELNSSLNDCVDRSQFLEWIETNLPNGPSPSRWLGLSKAVESLSRQKNTSNLAQTIATLNNATMYISVTNSTNSNDNEVGNKKIDVNAEVGARDGANTNKEKKSLGSIEKGGSMQLWMTDFMKELNELRQQKAKESQKEAISIEKLSLRGTFLKKNSKETKRSTAGGIVLRNWYVEGGVEWNDMEQCFVFDESMKQARISLPPLVLSWEERKENDDLNYNEESVLGSNVQGSNTMQMKIPVYASSLRKNLLFTLPLRTKVDSNAVAIVTRNQNIIAVGLCATKIIGGNVSTGNDSATVESFVMGEVDKEDSSQGFQYYLTGTSKGTRGTLYATNNFLEHLGVRFFTSKLTKKATTCPFRDGATKMNLPKDPQVFTPSFEYRQAYNYDVITNDSLAIKLYNNRNGKNNLPGGGIIYGPPGFVHLVNRSNNTLWNNHREWFWPQGDDTQSTYGQLCWSNESLVQYITNEVLNILKQNPGVNIISVSQNDNGLYCNSTAERKIYSEEGALIGPLLRAVNEIARSVKAAGYDDVAIDTLAYQWTRGAPSLTKPEENVIIRLCSIECDFSQPMTSSTNAAFAKDIKNWGQLTNRIWIWNYVTDFQHYVLPWPDYHSIVPNTKFFKDHGVSGIFQEGVYQTYGGDLAELKSYLMSRAMFDIDSVSSDNGQEVIAEFIEYVYGASERATTIANYITAVSESVMSTAYYMGESSPVNAKYLTPKLLLELGKNFTLAASSSISKELQSAQQSEFELASLPIYYVFINRWKEFRSYAETSNVEWPLPETEVLDAFNYFAKVYNEHGMSRLSEGGHDLAWLKTQAQNQQ
eukprot:g1642.t1